MRQKESLFQLTVRGFDPELERALRRLAREQDVSLNRAALKLMRQGAGLERSEQLIGAELDEFFGVWGEPELKEFEDATRAFSGIDPELWD